jgi:hypothetical protein
VTVASEPGKGSVFTVRLPAMIWFMSTRPFWTTALSIDFLAHGLSWPLPAVKGNSHFLAWRKLLPTGPCASDVARTLGPSNFNRRITYPDWNPP